MRSRDVIEFLGFPDCSSGFLQKVLCKVIQGNIGRIRDLIDVWRFPSFAMLSTFSWRCANEATPHYPAVELRVFGRLGFMLEATLY